MRQHDRLGAAIGTAGEQFKRAAAVGPPVRYVQAPRPAAPHSGPGLANNTPGHGAS